MQHVFSFTIAEAWAFLIYAAGAAAAEIIMIPEVVASGIFCAYSCDEREFSDLHK